MPKEGMRRWLESEVGQYWNEAVLSTHDRTEALMCSQKPWIPA